MKQEELNSYLNGILSKHSSERKTVNVCKQMLIEAFVLGKKYQEDIIREGINIVFDSLNTKLN